VGEETWTFEQLFEGLDPAPGFVAQLERLGLLRVVARDENGAKLYGSEAREQLEKVLPLVELGYQPKDIAVIAKKVGLPAQRSRRFFRRPPTYVHLAEVARQVGVDKDIVEGWLRDGHLEVVLLAEGGQPLFDAGAIEHARSLADLLAFGVGDDELTEWSTLGKSLKHSLDALPDKPPKDPSAEQLEQVEAYTQTLETLVRRLERWRRGIRRWDRLVAKHHKKLAELRRAYGLETETRRRTRKRLRLKSRSNRRVKG